MILLLESGLAAPHGISSSSWRRVVPNPGDCQAWICLLRIMEGLRMRSEMRDAYASNA